MGKRSAPPRCGENEAIAVGRLIRIGPRKLNQVAAMIRRRPVDKALAALSFCNKRVATPVRKTLEAAVANAENNHDLNIDSLIVAESHVGKSVVMKRWKPRSRGRVGRVAKHFCRLTVLVREADGQGH